MIEADDWRLQGQERFLKGKALQWKKYAPSRDGWEHDHCEFCSAKFSVTATDALREGYVTLDNYHWICPSCFADFREMFAWVVEPE
jgi:hypothetical protein